MKKQFIIVWALLAAFSCQKEQKESPVSPEGNVPASKYPVLRADIQDTKTTLDGQSMSFTVDDEIAVFNGEKGDDTHLPCRYKCTSIEGGSAIFTWDEENTEAGVTPDPDLETVVATYPYRSSSTSQYEEYGSGTLKIRMVAAPSTSQTTGFMKMGVPLVASAAKGAALSFKQTVGILRITMKGTATIKKVTMTSADNISGDASVSYAADAPVLTVTGTGKTITYTYESGIALNTEDGVQLCFGLPAGTRDVDFVFTDSEDKAMTVKAKDLTITRGYITPSSLTYAQDVVTTVDLSAGNKYANCYVVKAAGDYCFDARKPDGTTVSGASAVWVWAAGEAFSSQQTEAQLNAKMVSDISMENGKIYFSVPASFTVGNVVLGVINEDKDLLYTWHIWLTSNDLADITAQGITLMDRNLGAGAVYDVALQTNLPLQNGKGCFYQWGRKDPILGGRNSPSGAENPAYGTTNSQYTIVNSEAGINNVSEWGLAAFTTFTVEAGAARPVTMGNGPTAKPGYEAGNTAAWSKRTNANPCPYGYRPISSTEFTTLKEAGNPVISNYNNFAQVNLGGVIFARAGYRGGTDAKAKEGQGSSSTARYWTDTASSASQGILMKITWSDNTTLGTTWWSLAGFNANHACNVRCVKE